MALVSLFVMHVLVPRHTNYLIQCRRVGLLPPPTCIFGCLGPAIDSFGHKKYYVSFIDDYSKFTWIHLLHHKSEVSKYFLEFQAIVERLLDRKIIAVQSDWGGEYEKLNSLFKSAGISHHVSCPHTHQQNGSAEHKHRHIVEMGLALLSHASMPLKYWGEAFLVATYLIN
jgi:hypothetical protein